MTSPVRAAPRVVHADGQRALTVVTVAEDEPILAGHYPGFPIFPGVCVVECVHRSALAAPPAGAGALRLAEVRSTRFISPVFPGDELSTTLTWQSAGQEGWLCTAHVDTARGRVAQVRLRLTPQGTP